MTTEVFEQMTVYTIQGIGPYAIPHAYQSQAELELRLRAVDGSETVVDIALFTLDPVNAGSLSGGDLFLDATFATDNAGLKLVLERLTQIEQGWAGLLGAREKGLEAQLDRLTQATQDTSASSARALRGAIGGTMDTNLPDLPEGTGFIRQGDKLVPGPDEAVILAASTAAAAAATSETNATAAKVAAEAARDETIANATYAQYHKEFTDQLGAKHTEGYSHIDGNVPIAASGGIVDILISIGQSVPLCPTLADGAFAHTNADPFYTFMLNWKKTTGTELLPQGAIGDDVATVAVNGFPSVNVADKLTPATNVNGGGGVQRCTMVYQIQNILTEWRRQNNLPRRAAVVCAMNIGGIDYTNMADPAHNYQKNMAEFLLQASLVIKDYGYTPRISAVICDHGQAENTTGESVVLDFWETHIPVIKAMVTAAGITGDVPFYHNMIAGDRNTSGENWKVRQAQSNSRYTDISTFVGTTHLTEIHKLNGNEVHPSQTGAMHDSMLFAAAILAAEKGDTWLDAEWSWTNAGSNQFDATIDLPTGATGLALGAQYNVDGAGLGDAVTLWGHILTGSGASLSSVAVLNSTTMRYTLSAAAGNNQIWGGAKQQNVTGEVDSHSAFRLALETGLTLTYTHPDYNGGAQMSVPVMAPCFKSPRLDTL